MTYLKQELYNICQGLINDRDQLRLQLAQAHETISLLEMEMDAIKFHGDAAFAKMAEQREVTRHTFELVTDSIPGSYWLEDIWLSEPGNVGFLGNAEAAWKENMTDPQGALHIVGKVLKETTTRSEGITCNLFVAAVMLATGKTEEACANANEALRQCGTDFAFTRLAGIAHYLRGRVFLEIQSFRQAYWDFSLAVFTPGYHERAKYFQKHSESRCLDEEKQGQLLTVVADGPNGQPPVNSAPNQRPAPKLTPGIQAPTGEFKFEKAATTPVSAHKDL